MNENYIVHGTLKDTIDYATLIKQQSILAYEQTSKVIASREAENIIIKSNNNRQHKSNKNFNNRSVNTNKCNTLTNRRKVLTKSVPRTKVTK